MHPSLRVCSLGLLAALLMVASFSRPPGARGHELRAQTFDLVITNARIVDGSGNPWFRADLGIKNGRIAQVGRIDPADATKTIDAKDQILAPGFIDVHTHVESIYDHHPCVHAIPESQLGSDFWLTKPRAACARCM